MTIANRTFRLDAATNHWVSRDPTQSYVYWACYGNGGDDAWPDHPYVESDQLNEVAFANDEDRTALWPDAISLHDTPFAATAAARGYAMSQGWHDQWPTANRLMLDTHAFNVRPATFQQPAFGILVQHAFQLIKALERAELIAQPIATEDIVQSSTISTRIVIDGHLFALFHKERIQKPATTIMSYHELTTHEHAMVGVLCQRETGERCWLVVRNLQTFTRAVLQKLTLTTLDAQVPTFSETSDVYAIPESVTV